MVSRSAETETIQRLFAAYTRQGMEKGSAVMLIAASLSLPQKQVLDILDNERRSG